MINLLRSEFYKLFKGKMLYVILALVLLFVLVTAVGNWIILIKMNNPNTNIQSVGNLKSIINSGVFWGKNAPYGKVSSISVWLIAIAVLAAGITVSGFSNGTIKNIISVGKKRSNVYFAKLITLASASLIILLSIIVFSCVVMSCANGWGVPFTLNSLIPIIRMAGLEAVMIIALASFMMLIAVLIRNFVATIFIGFLIPLFLIVVNRLLSLIDSLNFLLIYFPDRLMSAVASPNPSGSDIAISLSVSAGIIIVSTLLGLYIFEKRDINIESS